MKRLKEIEIERLQTVSGGANWYDDPMFANNSIAKSAADFDAAFQHWDQITAGKSSEALKHLPGPPQAPYISMG
jgi:hypothetical protein